MTTAWRMYVWGGLSLLMSNTECRHPATRRPALWSLLRELLQIREQLGPDRAHRAGAV